MRGSKTFLLCAILTLVFAVSLRKRVNLEALTESDHEDQKVESDHEDQEVEEQVEAGRQIDLETLDREHEEVEEKAEAREKLLSKLGPIGARRYWLHSLFFEAHVFMTPGEGEKLPGYAANFAWKDVPIEELVMTVPIHEQAIAKTTERATRVSKMVNERIGDATCPEGVDLTLSALDVKTAIGNEPAIATAIGSGRGGSFPLWGFETAVASMGGSNKVLIVDRNGRTAALKWALQGRSLTAACVRATVPVEVMTFAESSSLGLSLLQEMTNKLFMFTDQGTHMRKLETFFAGEDTDISLRNRSSPSSCFQTWKVQRLSVIAKELDDSLDAEAWSPEYGAKYFTNLDNRYEERWEAFLTRLTTTYEPFYKHYQNQVKKGRAVYNIDCAGKDKEACAIPGSGIKKRRLARKFN